MRRKSDKQEETPAGPEFEEVVRAVARARWGLPPGAGSPDLVGGQEIDIVCRTEDLVHFIMCTTDRRLDKVTHDCNKLVTAKRSEEPRGSTVKLWMITYFEPTAEQKAAARPNGVTLMSVRQFRAALVDGGAYLAARWAYRFGSATDLAAESTRVPEDEYVPVTISDISGGSTYSVRDLVEELLRGEILVLLGPYGAGKSLTTREVFRDLRTRYLKQETEVLAIAINLREHWGQYDVDEVLRRHANRIGFSRPDQLVRAWNAGELIVLLDGFDEIASQTWRVGPGAMRATRRDALAVVRAFVEERPAAKGLLICGRDQYFDASSERRDALGLAFREHRVLEIQEWTDTQAEAYLAKKGLATHLPDWLPRKPLLLGYLAARGLLGEVLEIPGDQGVAMAWDSFLDRICEREALITRDVDGAAVRRVLELLAEKTRVTPQGILYERDLLEAYRKAAGIDPLESARVMLQRLPGMTARDEEEGGRTFVDDDMLNALRGSALAYFVQSPYQPVAEERISIPLGPLGAAVCARVSRRWQLPIGAIATAARESLARWQQPTLALDCAIAGGIAATESGEELDLGELVVVDGFVDVLDVGSLRLKGLIVRDSWVNELDLSDVDELPTVRVESSVIARVRGVAEPAGLPEWVSGCEVIEYDETPTNAAILRTTSIPLEARVLMVVLRKLFLQRGAARKESALFRGLDQAGQACVPHVLDLLEAEDMVFSLPIGGERVWHPRRAQQGRVRALLASGAAGDDPLMRRLVDAPR